MKLKVRSIVLNLGLEDNANGYHYPPNLKLSNFEHDAPIPVKLGKFKEQIGEAKIYKENMKIMADMIFEETPYIAKLLDAEIPIYPCSMGVGKIEDREVKEFTMEYISLEFSNSDKNIPPIVKKKS